MIALVISSFILLAPLVDSHDKSKSSFTCPRFKAGSVITSGPIQSSIKGQLSTQLHYKGGLDENDLWTNCFMMNDDDQSPTLRVNPGDTLYLTVTNKFAGYDNSPGVLENTTLYATCGSHYKTSSSVNVHFHGFHSPPQCHGDEVVRTIINKGETFKYILQVPANQPPGIFWYHPHVGGVSETAVKGGATGAIIVNGIVNYKPQLIGLREQIFIIRETNAIVPPNDDPTLPDFDLSINYVPITYPKNIPGIIEMRTGEKQFWRLVNSASTTILNITFKYDGIYQPYTIVSIDGSPLQQDKVVTSYIVGPGNRIEFILNGPSNKIKTAIMATETVFTGSDGDKDLYKPLAKIRTNANSIASGIAVSPITLSNSHISTPADVLAKTPSMIRTHYFSQVDNEITDETTFYITEVGRERVAYSRNNPPAVVVTQGTIEDWIIENRAGEAHVFHIHQIRFLVMAINGIPLPSNEIIFQDVVTVPYWSGQVNDHGEPIYPSVTLRLDFTANWIVGDFMYHCHILEHEDKGMMQILRVIPPIII